MDVIAGLTTHKTIAAGTTNATSVKASAGKVYGIFVNNQNAAVRYLKLYNKASAPTVGTDTPVLVFAIPPAGNVNLYAKDGIYLSLGIAFALTTGAADNDTTAVTASEHIVNLLYK